MWPHIPGSAASSDLNIVDDEAEMFSFQHGLARSPTIQPFRILAKRAATRALKPFKVAPNSVWRLWAVYRADQIICCFLQAGADPIDGLERLGDAPNSKHILLAGVGALGPGWTISSHRLGTPHHKGR